MRLEKGLCYISDIPSEALHTPESQAVRNRENWETPSDCGYRGMFGVRRGALITSLSCSSSRDAL